jgi:hypothetical protein
LQIEPRSIAAAGLNVGGTLQDDRSLVQAKRIAADIIGA